MHIYIYICLFLCVYIFVLTNTKQDFRYPSRGCGSVVFKAKWHLEQNNPDLGRLS